MAEWVTRIGRAATMGLAWALLWVPVGVVAARLIAQSEAFVADASAARALPSAAAP